MGNPFIEFGILIALLLLNGVFSASELALMSARKTRLEASAERGNKAARAAVRLAENPGSFLATVQVGITLIGTISAVFAGGNLVKYLEPLFRPLVGEYADSAASVGVVLLVAYLSLVLGELAPKNVALRNPEGFATRVAPLMTVLSRVARPVVWLLDVTTRGLLRLLGIVGERQEFVTEEDVRAMVQQAEEGGSLEAGESERIERVLRFTDRTVRDLMTPRPDVILLDLDEPLERVVDAALQAGHDHFPVRQRRGEREVTGVLGVQGLLRAVRTQQPLASLVREAVFIPESARAEDALELLEARGRKIAVVVDEYGDFTGLVSLGDLLAEIAGTSDASSGRIVARGDGSFLVDAAVPLRDLREVLPLPVLQDEDFNTVGGYVLRLTGRLPAVGEVVEVEGWTVEVLDLDVTHVDRVLLTPPAGVALREA